MDILDFDERVKAKEQKNLGPILNVPGEWGRELDSGVESGRCSGLIFVAKRIVLQRRLSGQLTCARACLVISLTFTVRATIPGTTHFRSSSPLLPLELRYGENAWMRPQEFRPISRTFLRRNLARFESSPDPLIRLAKYHTNLFTIGGVRAAAHPYSFAQYAFV